MYEMKQELQYALQAVKIQRTCVHDGPGIRTTVFFRGCALRCKWCQNPESLAFQPDPNIDLPCSLDEMIETVLRDKKYYKASGGGVTLSGGEPLLQDADALVYFLQALKREGVPVAVETTLHAPWETVEAVLPLVDLFLVDFKLAGDSEGHRALTGQDDSRIAENAKKLAASGAKIRYRTVPVPGHNDAPEAFAAMAARLKELGAGEIELLKYHNMYEEKTARMGLTVPLLNITPDRALVALKAAMDAFRLAGIEVMHAESEGPPAPAVFTDRVLQVQNDIREAPRALCVEVAGLKTKYYKRNKGFKKPTPIHRAERLKYVLENKTIKVYPGELLAGNFTSKRVAGQLWEEQYGVLYISFIAKINKQKPVPFECSRKERWKFYLKIFPFWLNNSIVRRAHPTISSFIQTLARVAENVAGFNNNFAAIAHFIPNFDRLLTLGTTGLIAEVQAAAKAYPENNQEFYKGAVIALEGLEAFAARYAEMLAACAEKETDAVRKTELAEMARIAGKVPKNPATSYREALQSILFMQVALCLEQYENAISFGRFDQILYPYYKKDLEEGIITYDEAKELLALFVLKMDEAILVNDGDSLLNVGKLFETLSTDQALTFGGVDKEGKDATNDITYMLVDICELQPLAVNMTARVHKGSPQRYLDRLAEVYINGAPMPELFSDEIYIESILRHYDTPVECARNYAIVGCVEPVASDDHFGNTDCSNMNLCLPMLQAIKGQNYDVWNYPFGQQVEKLVTRFMEYLFQKDKPSHKRRLAKREAKIRRREEKRGRFVYAPPADMETILGAFQERLNYLANCVLKDHQRIEETLRSRYTVPLASSLYKGCLKTGKDAYEGGTQFNSSGIQAVGVTDVADSFYAIEELVFVQKKYTLLEIIEAMDANFEGEKFAAVQADLLAVPKFGTDGNNRAAMWVTKVMEMYNKALDSVPNCPRGGVYTAGYYALNVSDRYGKKTQAIPSGRKKGVPLANSVAPRYGAEQSDLLSALNALKEVNFTDYAVNGTTATFTVDSALFPGEAGVKNLSAVFRTFLTEGGMQFQPNIVSRKLLQEAYDHPEKHKYLMVRVAGYCAYFNELSDELKKIIINRTCYA